jgi:hypothetical protein
VEHTIRCHDSVNTFGICLQFYKQQQWPCLREILRPIGGVREFAKFVSVWGAAPKNGTFQHAGAEGGRNSAMDGVQNVIFFHEHTTVDVVM